MKTVKAITTKFLILLISCSCSGQKKVDNPAFDSFLKTFLNHSVKELTVKDLTKKRNYLLLDARAKEEYQISHIPNALFIGYDKLAKEIRDSINKEKQIIVYCSVGYRSEKVAEALQKDGYKNVSNLYGGIFEWVNEGNTIHDLEENPTNKIHAFDKKWAIWLEKGEKIY